MENEGSMQEVIETLNDNMRKLVGAVNARCESGVDGKLLERLATIEANLGHLQGSLRDIKTALWGLAASVIGLIIKMVIEGSLR